MGFPTSHQPRLCVTLTPPKWVSDTQILCFCINFDKKALKVCYKVTSSKNFQRQRCSAVNYQSNGVNILAGDDPIPVKFWPKGTGPQYEGCTFHVSHAECCAVGVAGLLACSRYIDGIALKILSAKSPNNCCRKVCLVTVCG